MISSPFDRLDYPSLRQSVYLNQASLGLIGQPAVTAMHTFIDNVARHGNLYVSDSDELAYCETLRERASRLFHCDSSRVAVAARYSIISSVFSRQHPISAFEICKLFDYH